MDYREATKRITAAQKLLESSSISFETLESLLTLLADINPKIDRVLATCTMQLAKVKKFQRGELVELSAEALPENTEEQKKRKKALLLLIRTLKDLRGEIDRVDQELTKAKHSASGQASTVGRIIGLAKGPLGLVTLAAIALVLVGANRQPKPTAPTPTPKAIASYIIVNNHKIPLDKVHIGTGPDCDAPHYHAKTNGTVTATDGATLPDPSGCGYGKVSNVSVVTE